MRRSVPEVETSVVCFFTDHVHKRSSKEHAYNDAKAHFKGIRKKQPYRWPKIGK